MASSPNHGGVRAQTLGVVIHGTDGGTLDVDREYAATLAWFSTRLSDVSAHVVIAWDGTIATVVDPILEAWHAREYNAHHLGAELVHPKVTDPISDKQYESLAWWIGEMAALFGFPVNAQTIVEHREIPPGIRENKPDVGDVFDKQRLLKEITQ